MSHLDRIKGGIEGSIEVKQLILNDELLLAKIDQVAELMIHSLRESGKILFCGNGGSAADAQHLSAELSGRYLIDRAPLYAEALHVNSSFITAVANDYSFAEVFARQLQGIGKEGDVLIALTTSGNSENVNRAIEMAKTKRVRSVAMTGLGGGESAKLAEIHIEIPSNSTPRIQEAQMLIGHLLCELVESAIFAA